MHATPGKLPWDARQTKSSNIFELFFRVLGVLSKILCAVEEQSAWSVLVHDEYPNTP
jgi:hypothetical protein